MTVASVDELQVTASRGVKLVADALIADCASRTPDGIVLPGGMPGAEHLRDSPELIEMLREAETGRPALCGALHFAGGGTATPRLARKGPGDLLSRVSRNELNPAYASDERVVVDGNCVTSRAPAQPSSSK